MSCKRLYVHTASPPAPEISRNRLWQKHLLPRPQQKAPPLTARCYAPMLRRGPHNWLSWPLAANAYACNHLPAGLNAHGASAQGQQYSADQKTHKQGRSPTSQTRGAQARHPQTFQLWQHGQLRQRGQQRQHGLTGLVRHGVFPGLRARLPARPG